MKTECKPKRIEFQGLDRREVIGKFDGGDISSDGGGLLLREIEKQSHIIERFTKCFTDFRKPEKIEHTVSELLSQRTYGIALGYEDLNDHDMLRTDPLIAVLCGKKDPKGETREYTRDKGKALAGKSTLNRLELTKETAGYNNRYKKIVAHPEKIDDMFVDVFLASKKKEPSQIILDVDATDDPLPGQQEGRFFHGYYKGYCYLPLYIFCGDDLLCARLRPSSIDASEGTVEELKRIVGRIRQDWKEVEIIIRGDSGFCREEIMRWCEDNGIGYIFGLAKNSRLKKQIKDDLIEAKRGYRTTGRASRVYGDFVYKTLKSWTRSRRVISKAEYLQRGENPRFIVTSIESDSEEAGEIYEKIYCARGDMENRIKEQQLYLFADRTSTAGMRSNQIRLYFSSVAYMVVSALRCFGLKGTRMARAQCHTIRNKLFKIGVQIRVTVRKVWISFSEGYPYRDIFMQVFKNLHGQVSYP